MYTYNRFPTSGLGRLNTINLPQPEPLEAILGAQTCTAELELERYKYRPLSSNEDLRLLTLKHGKAGEDIQCTLEHSPLPPNGPSKFLAFVSQVKTRFIPNSAQSCPTYEALSYTWGSNEKSHVIYIDGELMPVTENLFGALQRLRYHDRPRTMWVDAVCINQEDVPERNSQVQHMDLIYKLSQKVLIWLGDANASTEKAFAVIKLFDKSVWRRRGLSVPRTESDDEHFFASFLPARESNVNMNAVFRLLSRPWFSRAWVIQEVSLGPDAQIVCGDFSCEWETLSSMLDYLHKNNLHMNLGGAPRQAQLMDLLRRKFHGRSVPENPIHSLLYLLSMTRHFLCQDSRDHIYSLLGLLPNKQLPSILVDYSIPCRTLYVQLAKCAVESDFGWFLLCHASHEKESSLDLPSWIPDWSLGPDGGPGNSNLMAGFAAGGKGPISLSSAVTGEILTLKGILFDSIHRVSKSHLSDSKIEARIEFGSVRGLIEGMKWEETFYQEVEDLSFPLDPYPTGEDILDVVSQTLVADEFMPEEDSQPFRLCYKHLQHLRKHREDLLDFPLLSWTPQFIGNSARLMQYSSKITTVGCQKRIATSKRRYLGWVPTPTKPGDLICIFLGSEIPFVLREEGSGYYKLIGECYIHGIMYGEALSMDGRVEREFHIQ
jgi:hypothetical protein